MKPRFWFGSVFILAALLINGGCSGTLAWLHDNVIVSEVRNARPVRKFEVPVRDSSKRGVQFIAVGDWGSGGKGQRLIAEAMAEKAKRDSVWFVLVLGDNFYQDGVASIQDEQWKTKFEEMYWQPSLQIPFYAVLGNHDYRTNPQAQVDYTGLSSRWRMPARYYNFVRPIDSMYRIDFFCLDTYPLSDLSSEDVGQSRDTAGVLRQLQWLEEDLAGSTALWKIVMGHHALYSNGEHGNNKGLVTLLEPLFDRFDVDLYIAGHDHHQELLKPVRGVEYIVSGGGSIHRDVTWRSNTIYAATNLGFTWFRVTRDDLLVEFITKEGKVDFAHVINK